MSPRRRRGRRKELDRGALAISVIGGVFAVVVGVTTPVANKILDSDPVPSVAAQRSCLQLQQDYYTAVHSSAAERKLVLPDADGKGGFLAADPQAQQCHITPQMVE